MTKFLESFDKYLKYYFLLSIIVVCLALLFLTNRLFKVESYLAGLSKTKTKDGQEQVLVKEVDICGEDCKKTIAETVSQTLATVSATPKATVKTMPALVPSRTQTAYIPLAGPITTTSTGWVDAAGTDVYIDLANDYGKNTWVSWEAFLQVTNGNGQAFARLYDVTHGIAVNGSEVSTTLGTSTQVTSGSLSFWAGKNLYRVQLKSLNSFVVTFASGRIKINY